MLIPHPAAAAAIWLAIFLGPEAAGAPPSPPLAPASAPASAALVGARPVLSGIVQSDVDEAGLDRSDVDEAVEALRRGDFAKARSLVDALFVADCERSARDHMRQGEPGLAIVVVDDALSVPSLGRDRRSALLDLRGRAAFAAASADVARASLFEEARANFEEAARGGAGASAAFRASRAARMMGDPQGALDLARAGAAWVDANPERAAGLDLEQPYTRTLAEASFGCYVAAAQELALSDALTETPTEAEKAAARALFDETKTALERTIGDAPTDTWAYRELSKLHLWASDRGASLAALEAALSVAPEDEAVHTDLVRALGDLAQERALNVEGATAKDGLDARFDAILGRYETFRTTHPENPLGYWYGAYETFYRALTDFESGSHDASAFRGAEALFRGCRERAPRYGNACIDYEILCRVGAGWCEYQAKESEKAVATFFSAEKLRPLGGEANLAGYAAGLDMRLAGTDGRDRLPSALAGLDFVIRRYLSDPNDVEALTTAASIGDRMFAARPEHANLANNAGFLNRDAAVLIEAASRRTLREAKTDLERAAGLRQRERADEIMGRSWRAYQTAARLLPDDVRVVNDAGLVMAYYLRTDIPAAEAYFLDSIRDGEVQLADPSLDEETRDALSEAWGDAHQNLGIIEMTIRSDPMKAKAWFEKALEIGPPSRNWLRDVLPLLDAWSASGRKPEAIVALEAQTVWTHRP